MRVRVRNVLASRPARYGVVLALWGLLAGCATSEAGRPVGASPSARRARVLLAMSDGSTSSGESSGKTLQGYNVPGRTPDSQAPWEFFMGNAAHRLIAYMYKVNHPQSTAYFNNKSLAAIVQDARIGAPSRLLPHERELRPDITDVSRWFVFEIKPWNDRGLQEGREEVQLYLAALNRAGAPNTSFTGGTDFQGQILIRFARGEYIWRLEWQTPEPGITQCRWTRSQRRFESERAAYEDGHWVELTGEELRQYGGWVGQAVEEMVTRREQLATVSGAMGVVIDIIGESARVIFAGAIFGRMSSRPGAQQPPAQGGGQVIPFPARPPAPAPPVQLPAAANGL